MAAHDQVLPGTVQGDHLDIHNVDRLEIQAGGSGGLGLKGLWALVGNSSAMVLLAVVMFMMIRQVQYMHNEGMATLKEILGHHVKLQETIIKDNTEAIRELSRELKALGHGNK